MERPAVDSVESEEEEDDSDLEHCIQFVLASCVGVAHKCTIHCLMGASSWFADGRLVLWRVFKAFFHHHTIEETPQGRPLKSVGSLRLGRDASVLGGIWV